MSNKGLNRVDNEKLEEIAGGEEHEYIPAPSGPIMGVVTCDECGAEFVTEYMPTLVCIKCGHEIRVMQKPHLFKKSQDD